MNTNSKLARSMLIVFALAVGVVTRGWAGSETVLHAFNGSDGWDGGSVIVGPGGTLYGTTVGGGGESACPDSSPDGCGVVFQLTRGANGKWRETVLHAFDKNNSGLWSPAGGLVVDGKGSLYGTAEYGGPNCSQLGCGGVFELVRENAGKWATKVLHYFALSDGANPSAGMIFDSKGNLYGTTSIGGDTACDPPEGCGVVFKLAPGAGGKWTETVLYSFKGSDGDEPGAPLTFDSAGNLYGATAGGGAHGTGTVFRLTPDAGGKWTERVLYSFGDYDTKDGYEPAGGLIFDGLGNLYGTTPFGGTKGQQGWGTAFKLTPDKKGEWTETVLHRFNENKIEGGYVSSALVFDKRGNLYGTTSVGGKYTCPGGGTIGCGVVFKLTPHENGRWTETVLHSFGQGNGGAWPGGDLFRDSAGHLFGVTAAGGDFKGPCGKGFSTGCGVVFEITP
jgi:uncharacterized repeat protein (TIGR03803 family)